SGKARIIDHRPKAVAGTRGPLPRGIRPPPPQLPTPPREALPPPPPPGRSLGGGAARNRTPQQGPPPPPSPPTALPGRPRQPALPRARGAPPPPPGASARPRPAAPPAARGRAFAVLPGPRHTPTQPEAAPPPTAPPQAGGGAGLATPPSSGIRPLPRGIHPPPPLAGGGLGWGQPHTATQPVPRQDARPIVLGVALPLLADAPCSPPSHMSAPEPRSPGWRRRRRWRAWAWSSPRRVRRRAGVRQRRGPGRGGGWRRHWAQPPVAGNNARMQTADVMRAMVLHQPGRPLVHEERPLPQPGPGEVRLRVLACAVCRTNLHVVDGELPHPALPVVPGHEIVGEVEAVGPGVAAPAIGDRVGVGWLGHTCGHCDCCAAGRENLCDAPGFTGYTRDGGFATHAIAEAGFCLPLPAHADPLHTAPLLCAGLIGWRALKAAGDGRTLGLYGFGAAAHLIAQVAIRQGRRVHAFTRPGDTQAQDFARSLGATW